MFALSALFVAVLLVDVLVAVFFVITVAYPLVPLRWCFEACGAPWWATSLAAIVIMTVGVGTVLASPAAVLFLRLNGIFELVAPLPGVATIELPGMVETVTLDGVVVVGLSLLRLVGRTATTAALVVLIELALFGFLAFVLLFSGDMTGRTLSVLVLADYRGAVTALNERACETLSIIYALQAAAAVGTFVINLVVFWTLGYDYAVTLAMITVAPQFIPIVGPSVLLAVMAVCHAVVGDVVTAALVVTLPAESVDLLGAGLRVGDVGGDGGEHDESVNDPVDPSQP